MCNTVQTKSLSCLSSLFIGVTPSEFSDGDMIQANGSSIFGVGWWFCLVHDDAHLKMLAYNDAHSTILIHDDGSKWNVKESPEHLLVHTKWQINISLDIR